MQTCIFGINNRKKYGTFHVNVYISQCPPTGAACLPPRALHARAAEAGAQDGGQGAKDGDDGVLAVTTAHGKNCLPLPQRPIGRNARTVVIIPLGKIPAAMGIFRRRPG